MRPLVDMPTHALSSVTQPALCLPTHTRLAADDTRPIATHHSHPKKAEGRDARPASSPAAARYRVLGWLLPAALLLVGSCSSGGSGTGDLTPQRTDWDALIWDQGVWQ